MEGAVESGKICSNEILKGTGKKIKIHKHGSKGIVLILQSIENIFYALRLRNVIIELILCLLIYIIFNLVIKLKENKKI